MESWLVRRYVVVRCVLFFPWARQLLIRASLAIEVRAAYYLLTTMLVGTPMSIHMSFISVHPGVAVSVCECVSVLSLCSLIATFAVGM